MRRLLLLVLAGSCSGSGSPPAHTAPEVHAAIVQPQPKPSPQDDDGVDYDLDYYRASARHHH